MRTRRQTERRQHDRPAHEEGYSHLVTVHLVAKGVMHKGSITRFASRFMILMEMYISIRILMCKERAGIYRIGRSQEILVKVVRRIATTRAISMARKL
jgi:hypothetical protein